MTEGKNLWPCDRIDYVDYGVQEEYGFFGKVVAGSDVTGFSARAIALEVAEMKEILGSHVVAVPVHYIHAA